MYIPTQFRIDDRDTIQKALRAPRLANLVTCGTDGLMATPLPLILDESEGEFGTLYGHVARANPLWKTDASEAMAIFMGPDAYITPSWYATKRESGKVVPTWNYVAIHAYGAVEFFADPDRLSEVVTRLTRLHEAERPDPWEVTDAPARFIEAQLRGIVGVRLSITRIDAKSKMSQNRNEADRAGVAAGLAASERASDREVADHIPS